jgi:hypothetical protein
MPDLVETVPSTRMGAEAALSYFWEASKHIERDDPCRAMLQ